jgi:hypothetical protein
MKAIIFVVWCSLLGICPAVWAQDHAGRPAPVPVEPSDSACVALDLLTPDCAEGFAEWQKDEMAWRAWMVDHGGRIAYSRIGARPQERLPRPEVPVWVTERCDLFDRSGFVPDDVCQFLSETLAYDWPEHVEVPEPPPLTRVPKPIGETGDFWTWFKKSLHYNGLWVVPDTRSRAFLLVGVHVAWAQVSERMYLFGPGIMLVKMDDGSGAHVYRPAQTWGVSIRLKDVTLFQSQREFSLYFNVANGRIYGQGPDVLTRGRGMTVVGFSISAKK